MKLFMATLSTETNTFSPIPTGRRSFTDLGYHRRDGSLAAPGWGNLALIEWRRLAAAEGFEIVDSVCASAMPAGNTVRAVYEELRDAILDDLRAALPVDLVLLKMHGAMVAEGYDDCEGDTLARVREIAGKRAVIGIELDLHCHLTEQMRRAADLIVLYKEYPHTDVKERARDLYALARRTQKGEVRPIMAYRDLRMINMWRTPVEPMKSVVAEMLAQEGRDGVLSVSFGHGFPWADVADVGAKMLVIADGDLVRAQAVAERFAQRLWALRDRTAQPHDTPDAAIDHALAAPRGPIVLADVADNAGGGAPSDNTVVLRRLLARGVRDAAIGVFYDPVAVQLCREGGVGARIPLRIGGKLGATSDLPVDAVVTVRGLAEDHVQEGLSGGKAELGASAWVEADGVHVILSSIRGQVLHPTAFENLGCTLADKRIVVVKSIQHFYAAFAPIAAEVRYVAAPGAVGPDFAAIPYTKLAAPYWPKVADPWA
jgi:microcystin degradation protein MlrC